MGASTLAADAVSSHAAEYGIQQVVENELAVKVGTHIAFDAAAMAGEHAHTEHKRKKEAMKAEQLGLIIQAPAQGGANLGQEVPPDGFYPVVPIPQGHSNVQSGVPTVVSNNCPHPNSSISQESLPPPPQYPGLPLEDPYSNPFPEKKEIIPGPPPVSSSESDSKYRLVIVEQEHTRPPPLYAPPPAGAVPVMEKMGQQVYSPQAYPQQHYPPPPVQPSSVSAYPSYPGTVMSPPQAGPSNMEAPLSGMPASMSSTQPESRGGDTISHAVVAQPPPETVPSTPVQVHQTQLFYSPPAQTTLSQIGSPIHQTAPLQQIHRNSLPPPPPLPMAQPTIAPPPQSQPISTPSYIYQNSNQYTSQDQSSARPPLQHQNSYSISNTQVSNNPYHTYAPPPPPSQQTYQPTVSHPQHPTFAPNSFPPPPPPSNYPLTPAQTPGSSYPQYVPAQHAPSNGYPGGYPTPIPTPYTEYGNPMAPRQYVPENKGFPQYQEVPIPGPQILSQQGQYLEQQAAAQQQYQYQHQSSGYPPQTNMYY
ncbi:hypothetical protein TWF730_011355 [Orbilia blumenaviensis]|uniref:Uncharacterized protein n=1 Tax=Orbilia blumenaviensis TaxID=1796055 RepID=A0AAV9ULR0_9PEZI